MLSHALCFPFLFSLLVVHGTTNTGSDDNVRRFVDNLAEDGTVKIIWKDGASYNGGWKDGKKSGKGTYMYADKKIYSGNWQDDLYHGVGVLRTPSGSSYNGMWGHGAQNGQGELRYGDGSLYFGDFVNNVQEGYGILKYVDGGSYEGTWQGGLPDGTGVLRRTGGWVEYEGRFRRGRRVPTAEEGEGVDGVEEENEGQETESADLASGEDRIEL